MLKMEPRSCPVCASRDESRVFAPANLESETLNAYSFASRKLPEYLHARLIECPTCDVVYANPAIAAEALASAYDEAAFDSQEEAGHASRTYGAYLARIAARLPDLEGALDIGTGEGSFLRELIRAGFRKVVGVEPSRAPIEAAAPDVRPLIRREMFQTDTFRPETFRLITCFQTIEHLRDPLAICRDAYRALKPGGAFFLIGHNRRAISAKVLGRKSPIFDVEHLQLFSPASFRNLLGAAGFASVTVEPIFNRYPLHYWARLFPFPKRVKPSILRGLKASLAGRVMIPLPAGNLAAVGYKPLTQATTGPGSAGERAPARLCLAEWQVNKTSAPQAEPAR
jgi:SAM-dependent methyltransferase